jgi:hypothetical protein
MATTEDSVTYALQVTTVPAYDPSNPYPVLDTPFVGYDQLVLSTSQNIAVMPSRGY